MIRSLLFFSINTFINIQIVVKLCHLCTQLRNLYFLNVPIIYVAYTVLQPLSMMRFDCSQRVFVNSCSCWVWVAVTHAWYCIWADTKKQTLAKEKHKHNKTLKTTILNKTKQVNKDTQLRKIYAKFRKRFQNFVKMVKI